MTANNLKRADRRRMLEQVEEEQTMTFLAAIRAAKEPECEPVPETPRCPVCAAIKLASEW